MLVMSSQEPVRVRFLEHPFMSAGVDVALHVHV